MMDISAITPVGNATQAPLPTTAAESTYLIDTYGAPAIAALVVLPPVYAHHATALVSPVDPVVEILGSTIDTFA
jgi:hypothetical protein